MTRFVSPKRSLPRRSHRQPGACFALLLCGGGWLLRRLRRYMDSSQFYVMPVLALWLYVLAVPNCRGPTRRMLASRPMRWLGEVSYALYTTHWPMVCERARVHIDPRRPSR